MSIPSWGWPMEEQFRREYMLRLPLPLAQLYSRAHNAKDARSRHDNCYYLFELLIKLSACPLTACYVDGIRQGSPRVPKLDQLLLQLAFPSFGQWMGILRELARHFGSLPDAASHPMGQMWKQLNRPHHDPSALVALYRRIKNGPDGAPSGDKSCSILQLLEALGQYRNGVIGHGAGRFESFFAHDMGPLLFPAVNEILAEGVFSPLGPQGARLVYFTELRAVSQDRFELSMRELTGSQGERMAPLTLEAAEAAGVAPNRVAVLWPGRRVPLRLDPLMVFRESELADDVLLLNGERSSGRQVEYLSYTTGRTERTKDTATELAAMLSILAGREVTASKLQQLTEQSQAATPSVELLTEPPAPARRRTGDYEILAEIGRGGMGVVYLARQLSLGRLVALKMLPADLAGDEVALARFRREMRALGRCDHPNIVKLLDSGAFANGQMYYTMEYVSGCDLDQVWTELSRSDMPAEASKLGNTTFARAVISASGRRRKEVESRYASFAAREAEPAAAAPEPLDVPKLPLPPLPPLPEAGDESGGYVRKVVALIRDAAQALQTVHDQGIIHRDISPGNLMLTPDGSRVVLMDFGLAKGQDLPSIARSLTEKGGFVGKLRYAAREQLSSSMLKVGPQADVHGMGVTLWELLTRKRLFSEAQDERQLAAMILERDVPRLRQMDPGFDRDLEAIVARATEGRASDRLDSAGRMAEYLQLYLEGKPLPIRTPTLREIAWRWAREHRAVAAAAAAALAAIVGALIGVTMEWKRATAAEKTARQAESLERAARGRADQKTAESDARLAASFEEQGRQELFAGNPLRAVAYLSQAYSMGRSGAATRFLLAQTARAIPARVTKTEGHTRGVYTAEYSRDGAKIVTAGRDGRVIVWDAADGRILQRFELSRTNEVSGAMFSPDGERVVAADDGGHAAVWGTVSGRELFKLDDLGTKLYTPRFSPDGTRMLIAGEDGKARLWDLSAAIPPGPPIELRHDGPVLCAFFSPDGTKILTGSEDRTARIWDGHTGAPIGRPLAATERITRAVFSPDASKVLVTSADPFSSVQVFDAETHERLAHFSGHSDLVRRGLFSPDGKMIVTSGKDAAARLWTWYPDKTLTQKHDRLEAGTTKEDSVELPHEGLVYSAAFSHDGRRVGTASRDRTVNIWDTATGGLYRQLKGHTGYVYQLVFSPDDRCVLTASEDHTARVWDVATARLLLTLDGRPAGDAGGSADPLLKTLREGSYVRMVSFAPAGHVCVTTSDAPVVRDAESLEEIVTLASMAGRAQAAQLSPDGRRVVAVDDAHDVAVLDVAARSVRQTRMGGDPAPDLKGAVFSPDGRRILVAGTQAAWILDAETLETRATLIHTTEQKKDVGAHAEFSPDGRLVVTTGADWTAKLFDAATGALTQTLQHNGEVTWATFSPDSRQVLTASRDGTAMLWDAAGGQALRTLKGHSDYVLMAVFSLDGRRIITASRDYTARVWDAATGALISSLERHDGLVTCASFSPDGALAVTASEDGQAKVWDAGSGKLLCALKGHLADVRWAQFTPDGDRIFTAGEDRTLRVWDAHLEKRSPDEIAHLVKERVPWRLEGERLVPVRLEPE